MVGTIEVVLPFFARASEVTISPPPCLIVKKFYYKFQCDVGICGVEGGWYGISWFENFPRSGWDK